MVLCSSRWSTARLASYASIHVLTSKQLQVSVSFYISLVNFVKLKPINVCQLFPMITHNNCLYLLRASCLKLGINECRCYVAKIEEVKRPAAARSQTQDTSGLSHHTSYITFNSFFQACSEHQSEKTTHHGFFPDGGNFPINPQLTEF